MIVRETFEHTDWECKQFSKPKKAQLIHLARSEGRHVVSDNFQTTFQIPRESGHPSFGTPNPEFFP